MSEQKTMNRWEAIKAVVEGKIVVDSCGLRYRLEFDRTFIRKEDHRGSFLSFENHLPENDYTIYQEPPKMKTWYRVFFTNGNCIFVTNWYPSLEEAISRNDARIVTHEERQFPEVG